MTSRTDPVSTLAHESAWVPEGVWFDLPTGRRYEVVGTEGHGLTFHRDLAQLPVLARAGSLVPLAEDLSEAAGSNPRALGVLVVPGADGQMVMEGRFCRLRESYTACRSHPCTAFFCYSDRKSVV